MTDLSQSRWADQLSQDSNAVILDVRTAEELESGFIPGAVHLDIGDPAAFYEEAQKLDPGKNYYIYCGGGDRSRQACLLFQSWGISNTYNLNGGIDEWKGKIEKNEENS